MDRLQLYSLHQVLSDTTTVRSARFVKGENISRLELLKSHPLMGCKSPITLDMYRQVEEVLGLFKDRFILKTLEITSMS